MERETGVALSMLRELRIKNIALIDDVTIEFKEGFSVFTGETGAGKSILVGAVGLLLGDRASVELVRAGSEEAEVIGVFELKEIRRPLRELLTNNNVPVDEGSLIVRRTVSASNRNRTYLNQVPVPLSVLSKVGDVLIDFHGQHEHQSLLNPETARSIIDSLRGVTPMRENYDRSFAAYQEAKVRLEAHDRATVEREQKREVIEFQYNELKNLGLLENEESGLEEELRLLSSTAQRVQCVSQIESVLSSSDASLSGQIQTIRKNLETLNRFDSAAGQWLADIGTASAVFSELESFCGSYLEKGRIAADPARIESINDRLAKIQRLKKKYTCSYGQLFDKMDKLKSDLEALENAGADRSVLEKEFVRKHGLCSEAGSALGTRRRERAAQFDATVTKHMEKLGFPGGLWHTVFTPYAEPQPHGLEDCSFLIRTNPGEQVLPLVKIASGGEISRLMLAVKTVLAAQDDIPVLVFDEIDTGIGGLLAKEVAKSLVALCSSHQLLCISHLHQIASQADHHYHVYKEAHVGRTVTRVVKLGEKERIDEIARMLGGETEISRKHAEELLRKKNISG
jgi:DNA repair protein RecN (Recombination protein N)